MKLDGCAFIGLLTGHNKLLSSLLDFRGELKDSVQTQLKQESLSAFSGVVGAINNN